MAINDFNLGLIGKLDGTKSKHQLNNDIEALKKQLNSVEITTKLDPKALGSIQIQLQNLQAQLGNVSISQSALNGLVSQINSVLQHEIQISGVNLGNIGNQAQQVGQQIGNQINQGVSQSLSGNTGVLDTFRRSLQNIGMGSEEIDAVANRIENLGVKIEALNQSTSHTVGRRGNRDILSVDISGTDKLGQAIKLTEQYNMATGDLIRSMDSVSTAQQKAGSSTNTFAKQQSQAVTNLTNQINQLNRAANDQNKARPITDSTHLDRLSTAYNEIISAIQRMGNASSDTFVSEQNNVKTLISNYKSLVSEFRNAENVSTKMKGTDFASGLAIAKNDLEKFKADAKDFPQIIQTINNLDTAISNVGDASSLNKFNDDLRVARSELAKIKSETSATNRNEKVGINVSGLQSQIADLQRISPEIDKFEANINGAKVTVQSLLTDLANVNTQSDFSVINSKWKAFTDSAKSAGIAISEVATKSDSLTEQVNKIQLLSNGGIKNDYATQIAKLEGDFRSLGLAQDTIATKTQNVKNSLATLRAEFAKPVDQQNFQAIQTASDNLQRELIESRNEFEQLRASMKGMATEQQRLSLANTIEAWNQKNTAATKAVREENERYVISLRDLSNQMTRMDFNKINTGFKQNENSMRALNRLGASLKDQFTQAYRSFTMWLSASTMVMKVISETREAFTELKEINTILTEISKANENLTKDQLTQIGNNSFDIASKYGKTATDFLSGVQEASRAGYTNAEAMAELSTAAQGAGDMTADVANQFIIATDKAYKLGGSVQELTKMLDGVNYITNHNAVNMTELSEAMTIVGSTAASFGVETDELTAALGTMAATTQQSGSEVARAFRAILLNIRQVSDEEEGIDAEGLTKYEKACNALGVSLKETRNGVLQTRDAMDVLRDLSVEYSKLEENDLKRTNLLNSVGGKLRSTQLDALLRNWSTYETMLQQYADGTGSMQREADKTAKSWEGSLNRLKNTWTDTVENIISSDLLKDTVNFFNTLLTGINDVTSALGTLGTIATISGGILGAKNLG